MAKKLFINLQYQPLIAALILAATSSHSASVVSFLRFEWGGTFAMDPNLKKLTTDAECEEVAAKIRAAIKG